MTEDPKNDSSDFLDSDPPQIPEDVLLEQYPEFPPLNPESPPPGSSSGQLPLFGGSSDQPLTDVFLPPQSPALGTPLGSSDLMQPYSSGRLQDGYLMPNPTEVPGINPIEIQTDPRM